MTRTKIVKKTDEELKKEISKKEIKKELKPCPLCGRKPGIETWYSGGFMCMIKCNTYDCPIPKDSYPKGGDLEKVKEEWNRMCQESETKKMVKVFVMRYKKYVVFVDGKNAYTRRLMEDGEGLYYTYGNKKVRLSEDQLYY